MSPGTVGVDDYYAQLLPGDKVLRVEQLIESSQAGSTAFVGDGINDAPVLSRADVELLWVQLVQMQQLKRQMLF